MKQQIFGHSISHIFYTQQSRDTFKIFYCVDQDKYHVPTDAPDGFDKKVHVEPKKIENTQNFVLNELCRVKDGAKQTKMLLRRYAITFKRNMCLKTYRIEKLFRNFETKLVINQNTVATVYKQVYTTGCMSVLSHACPTVCPGGLLFECYQLNQGECNLLHSRDMKSCK